MKNHRRHVILGCVMATTACLGPHAEPEQHLIPSGYMGDVIIIHGASDGEPAVYDGRRRVYNIPETGILRSQTPPNFGWTWGGWQFFYVNSDGSRQPITVLWASTIHDTPENRRDDQTVGIFFPTTGTVGDSADPCRVQFTQYYVGTKAFLLSRKSRDPVMDYLRAHSVPCEEGVPTE